MLSWENPLKVIQMAILVLLSLPSKGVTYGFIPPEPLLTAFSVQHLQTKHISALFLDNMHWTEMWSLWPRAHPGS